jgi:four helix bundle suffix protein
LTLWKKEHERYNGLLQFCKDHNEVENYTPYYEKWDRETFCNVALTLLHQADKGLMTLIQRIEAEFLQEGGVKERMTVARKQQRGY